MRRTLLVSLTVLSLVGMLALAPGTANAIPQTHTSTIDLQGASTPHILFEKGVFCDDCAPDALFDCGGCQVAAGAEATIHTKVTWAPSVSIDSKFDPDELHQGQTASIEDSLTPKPGPIKVVYQIDYAIGIFACDGNFDPCGPDPKNWQVTGNLTLTGTKNLEAGTDCTPALSGGSAVVCAATKTINLLPETCFFPLCPVDVTVDLVINHTFTVDPGTTVVTRTASLVPDTDLTFNDSVPSVVNDSLTVPCSAAVGTTIQYGLGPASWGAAHVHVDGDAGLHVIIDGPGPLDADPTIGLVAGTVYDGEISLSGPAAPSFPLGDVLLDNVAPSISALLQAGTFVEGSDTQFTLVATDNCTTDLNYDWLFSDGGTAFASVAHHTFADNGSYTGEVTVKDAAGNTTEKDFTVNPITNADPDVTAPPDATALWGVPIQFHADAVDPGSADQSTLSYHWSFGDGSGKLGSDVSHAYDTPAVYAVSLAVTDKDGGVGTAGMTATISARATSIAYTGAVQALPNKYATLSAVLTDELGSPVVGKTVTFSLGTQSITGITDQNGLAMKSLKLNQKPGDYTVSASFAGDAKYGSSSDSADFTIGK